MQDLQMIFNIIENDTMNLPIAEVGVYKGTLFRKLVQFSMTTKRECHAFDSFCGMDTPTESDGKRYSKGAMNCGGLETFYKIMRVEGFSKEDYIVHEGYVPDCLDGVSDKQFIFVYIDLDHYQPTVDAIHFFHERIPKGGVLGFDDFYHKKDLASKAILEFMDSEYAKEYSGRIKTNNAQIFFIK